MVDRSDTFVREVDEELRREQMQQLWDKYGIYAVGLLVLVLAGIGGYNYLKSQKIKSEEATGVKFETATRLAGEGKSDEANAIFAAIAKEGAPGYQTLARLRLAAADLKVGKSAEALAAYEALSKETSADPVLREFAGLQAAMLRMDTADWTEMQNRLTPLTGEKSPWRAAAREVVGTAAYKAGKLDEARKAFEQLLSDRTTPQSMQQRAQLMLSVITDAEADKAQPAGGTSPAPQAKDAAKPAPEPKEERATKR